MSSKDFDKDPNENKDDAERPVHITEEHLFNLIERGSQMTAAECFKHFEKFHKEEMQFQRKAQLEDKELSHQREIEERDFKRKNLKMERWWRVFAIVLAAAGFYLFWFGSIETEKATSLRATREHQIDLIRADIAEKKKILQVGTEAISSLRLVDAEIIRNCKYSHPYSQEKQDAVRRAAQQKIIDAFAVAPYIFNEPVLEKIKELLQFELKIKDVCMYKGNYDNKLLQYKTEIFDPAAKSIAEDKEKIEKLK